MAGFIPSREADLVTWSSNFNALINAAPTGYGLTAAQGLAYEALHDSFVSAFNLAANASTRTPSSIIAKDLARRELIASARSLARIIQAFPGVTDSQRSDLGLTVRTAEPSPVPPPALAPDIDLISVTGRTVKIRLHDALSPTRRGKPDGVDGASVFSYVGAEAPATLAEWTFVGSYSRTVIEISFDASLAPGTKVWLSAFWFNPRNQAGPACDPVSTNLQFGSVSMAA